ncbi:MAG: T9SS outer membrane translocon Sov/SprA [Luteibaculaceae bacterium]
MPFQFQGVTPFSFEVDSPEIVLPFPITDPTNSTDFNPGLIDLNLPENIKKDVIFDPITGRYIFVNRIGEFDYRAPSSMSIEEYLQYDMERSIKGNWQEEVDQENQGQKEGFAPQLQVEGRLFDRIFGGNTIEIKPQGSAELTFGANMAITENPRLPERQRRITTFNFDQRIQLNALGKIGEKMQVNFNYNTEATFDFENQIKLEWTGEEDDIIKKIEAGNVNMPLPGSLISGSQSLFGFKSELQFGKLRTTLVFSQQQGERQEILVQGGASKTEFEITADDYEANRHYFLSHFFRDNYDRFMRSVPIVNSGFMITRIEVWITNQSFNFEENRNFVAFTDLGEDQTRFSPNLPAEVIDTDPSTLPSNNHNNLYQLMNGTPAVRDFTQAASVLQNRGYQFADHFEPVENARRLSPAEYTFNSQLGFISLNQSLNNDEVLAVAYEYTFQGRTFQVGDFSTDGIAPPRALLLKMLKGTVVNPDNALWDLMAKHIYNLGAFQVQRENFMLNIMYNDPVSGFETPVIPQPGVDAVPIIQLLDLDRLTLNGSSGADGVFDFIDNASTAGGTINSQTGRVFFTTVEPFGSHLDRRLEEAGIPANVRRTIVFQPLYDSTKIAAQLIPRLNRFKLVGSYQSSSSNEIPLNALNVPPGSVTVTAGGVLLVENQDYTVDYSLGRVKILNTGLLESQTPIRISLESNSMFNIILKRMMGARFDYTVNPQLNIGATILNLSERPLTQIVNFGDEPVNNTIWGLDFNYSAEAPYLTKLVNKLPGISTKEKSNITVSGEFAHLIPGHSRAVGRNGNAYIDDFEGSLTTIDLRQINGWHLASTPQHQPDLFPEAALDSTFAGFNRARLAWYIIDPLFWDNNNLTPGNITSAMQSDHRTRRILEQEVFPNRQLPTGVPPNIATLDLAFYPNERGMYNYNAEPTTFAAGLTPEGLLANPRSRWGGIMRALNTTDFEVANVEYIQFWVMDPYNEDADPTNSIQAGDLYINLGSVSEDVLKDGRKSFENGLPRTPDDQSATTIFTPWGRIPTSQTVVNAFDNTTGSNATQDIGYDGLNSAEEAQFFAPFLQAAAAIVNPGALGALSQDPSADDYAFYRGQAVQGLNILERYKRFNGLEGNSVAQQDSPDPFPTAATTLPDNEDINLDNNLNQTESYFQYQVSFRRQDLVNPDGTGRVGHNFMTDFIDVFPNTPDGTKPVRWYQFKVPIRSGRSVNGIRDFRAIRFMRMFLKDFEDPTVLRFARLELVRGEWRTYLDELQDAGEVIENDPVETSFIIQAVNIEENGNRQPIPYVLPPGIEQQIDAASANLRNLNEQSLSMIACNLQDGDARAIFRNMNLDALMYGKIEMFVHLEEVRPEEPVNFGDVSIFVRLGSDFNDNFYEYEIPLTPTPWGTIDRDLIWPEANNVEIELAQLRAVKLSRTRQRFPINQTYVEQRGRARISVKGNPNFNNILTIMIGVRNPAQTGRFANPWIQDDGLAKCFEVWINELRLTDFNNSGGWAALGRVDANLADLGRISVAGNISTPQFGALEQRIQQRQQETITQIDASTNLELGRFFGENSGIRIPLYLGYSNRLSNPQFNPLSPDVPFDDALDILSEDQQGELRSRSQDFQQRRAMNLTNMRKERVDSKKAPMPYDIENFALTLSYNEIFMRDINTEFNIFRNYKGALDYSYTPKAKEYKPFGQVARFQKSKYWDPIKDFNFYLVPKRVAFRTLMDRNYNAVRLRNNTEFVALEPIPQFNKIFFWNRLYDVKYDLTKSLKIDYTATNLGIVGEPDGRVDRNVRDEFNLVRDSIWRSIRNFGETTQFNQRIAVNYQLPFNKFPLTDFINANARYTAIFQWDRAPFAQDTLGGTIQNSRDINLNAQLNMRTLYNKSGYVKRIEQKARRKQAAAARQRAQAARARQAGKGTVKTKEQIDEEIRQLIIEKIGEFTIIPKDTLKTYPEKEQNQYNRKKKRYDRKFERNKRRIERKREKEKEAKQNFNLTPTEQIVRTLTMIKSVNTSYTVNEGTFLPGYGMRTSAVGLDPTFSAPGLDFILGNQDPFFAQRAGDNGWLVQQPFLNAFYAQNRVENFNARASIEPIPNFKIELQANEIRNQSNQSIFRFSPEANGFVNDNPMRMGNYSVSIIALRTSFISHDPGTLVSPLFENFLENRTVMSSRLGERIGESVNPVTGFVDGFGPAYQDVIVTSFLAAYLGENPGNSSLSALALPIAPNWRITYDGFNKIPFFAKYFKTFSMSHAYQAMYTVGNYQTNLQALDEFGFRRFDPSGNFIPLIQLQTVTISEQFSPLINIDATLQNSLIARVEIRRDRTVALSLTNLQVTEMLGNEFIIGSGYRFRELRLPVRVGGRQLRSDLNLRGDLSIRDNEVITRIRNVDQQLTQNQLTSGQRIFSIRTSADYNVSTQLNVRAFYDHQINTPKISVSFPTANINFGFSLRFTFN